MSNSFDETIKIWDIRNSTSQNNRYAKNLTGHLQGNEKNLIRGSWSHDGLYISCGSIDKCVYIWDVNTRKIVQRLGGHTGTVNQADMSFINKKSHLATGSNDKNIIVS
jgi:Prp8 binding protein